MSADGDITAIAVVIPCPDDGATLEEAIESVWSQDAPDEIVVVDDGSTDRPTGAAPKRVAAADARVLRRPNRAPTAAPGPATAKGTS
jgi:glycosyltransferase involved in cell wall biosynthesis